MQTHTKNKFLRKIKRWSIKWYFYCKEKVWKDQRRIWYVDLIKTVNLSVNSYLDKNLQSRASSLTYSTLLSIVPALALLLAIARGFGFQDMIKEELHHIFPSQSVMIDTALGFVDQYLATASGGLFVGIGIVFLLWTLISLLRNIEITFNYVWGVKTGRSIYRMITDYTTIIIVLPILMICSGGISLFMSSFVQNYVYSSVEFLSPVATFFLDIAPWVLTCLFFGGMYILIPYTKVKPKYAMISGFICGSLFQLLQYLFVTGQMYVTKYNAIYGSFSFLPLFMIWMYLTWLICISGVVLTYSAQNIFRFNYMNQIRGISQKFYDEVAVYVMFIVVDRFNRGKEPLTQRQIMENYNIPMQLLNIIINKFTDAGIFSVILDDSDNTRRYQPALNVSDMTLFEFMDRYRNLGYSRFVPELRRDENMKKISELLSPENQDGVDVKISDILRQVKFSD